MNKTGDILVRYGKRFDAMRALIVDRDEITAGYAARAFRRLGISYEFAENTKLAVRMIEEAAGKGTGYDVCLLNCDLDWPEMDDRLFGVKSGDSFERPVVACCFRHGSNNKGAMERIGGDYYIEQPILQSKLYRMMTEVTGEARFAEKSLEKSN